MAKAPNIEAEEHDRLSLALAKLSTWAVTWKAVFAREPTTI